MTSSRGATISTTGIVSCHEYSSMIASVAEICRTAQIHSIPPSSVNSDNVSTSAVTRATNTPRRSRDCVAIESWWMCSNPRTRSAISASSEARTSRRAAVRPATNATKTSANAAPQSPKTNPGRNPPSNPWSKICCTRIGTTRLPTTAPSETTTVRTRPRRSSGLSRSPAIRTRHALLRCSGIGSSSRLGAPTGASSIDGGTHRSPRSYARIIEA